LAKEESIEIEGVILEALPNAQFKVKLENSLEVLAHVSGKTGCTISEFCLVTRLKCRFHLTIFPKDGLHTGINK